METATVLIIFIASLLFGVTGYSMYAAFGPGSKNLRDPFEDHGVIRFSLENEGGAGMYFLCSCNCNLVQMEINFCYL